MNPFTYNSETHQQRPLVTWLVRICLLAGCLYTGTHNYALYLRGLGDTVALGKRQAVAFAIAFLLEAAFYFSVEGRGRVFVTTEQRNASAYGAIALFVVIALNTVTDHAMTLGKVREGDWLGLWATYGAAAMVVAVVGYIGYLKAHSPQAQLAAAAATAEAARVQAKIKAQAEILTDEAVVSAYRAEARKWALDGSTVPQLPAAPRVEKEPHNMPGTYQLDEAETNRPNGKGRWE